MLRAKHNASIIFAVLLSLSSGPLLHMFFLSKKGPQNARIKKSKREKESHRNNSQRKWIEMQCYDDDYYNNGDHFAANFFTLDASWKKTKRTRLTSNFLPRFLQMTYQPKEEQRTKNKAQSTKIWQRKGKERETCHMMSCRVVSCCVVSCRCHINSNWQKNSQQTGSGLSSWICLQLLNES